MKLITTIFFALFISTIALAQIPNSSFENILSGGHTSNWNPQQLAIIVFIDSNGVAHHDSLSSTSTYFISNDAHTGTKAIQLNNIFDYTASSTFVGQMTVADDTDAYSSFANSITLTQQPDEFSFYYKFNQVGNDTAFAHVDIFDSLGMLIGDATILIPNAASTYTKASANINYRVSVSIANLAMIEVATAAPNTQAHFRTTFLVDDFSLNRTTGVNEISADNSVQLFPNPSSSKIYIQSNSSINKIEISNSVGQLVRNISLNNHQTTIDVSNFDNGIYFLKIFNADKSIAIQKISVCK